MSIFYDSTNVTDLWLMDATAVESGEIYVPNYVDGGEELWLSDSIQLVDGLFGKGVEIKQGDIIYSDSTSGGADVFTAEWLCKYVDIATSDEWWADADWHAFAVRRDSTSEEFLVDATSVETHSPVDFNNSFSVYIDSTDYILDNIRISNIYRTNEQLLRIQMILAYGEASFSVGVADYKDAGFIAMALDETSSDGGFLLQIPDHKDTSMFVPTPGYLDYPYLSCTADYVDGAIRIPSMGVIFHDNIIIIPIIVTSYCDSGGIQEGIFLNVECYFGFTDTQCRIGCVTDNLAEASHILVSTQEGHGPASPVMLTEYGPYFGVSNSYRILHYNWTRHIQRYYGYETLDAAMEAVNYHRSNGGVLVDLLFDPPSDGWYIMRWRDTQGGAWNYAFFNNLGSVNTYYNKLVLAGKIDIESHIWESTMPYFNVWAVTATYLLSQMSMTADDVAALANISGYVWSTIVTDNSASTYWENENGMSVPHWVRVIF